MQQISLENRNTIAIYLDHCKLINQTYNEELDQPAQGYKLKAALFHFAAKLPNQTKEIAPQKPAARTKKRKSDVLELDDNSDSTLQLLVSVLLPRLQNLNVYVTHHSCHTSCTNLTRYWEEHCSFPQFNGANNTHRFQSFHFGSQNYLIPPHCRFFNCDIAQLTQLLPQFNTTFDLITLDPPWRNKYIRRLKRVRHALAYQMLDNEQLRKMPIAQLLNARSLVAIWCTNSTQHQQTLVEELLPAWHLRLLHRVHWLKVNIAGHLIGPLHAETAGHKQPFEMLYLTCHKDSADDFGVQLRAVEALVSVPSIVHSHKPPLLPWLREILPEKPQCLELFARYLQPGFTSVGLEVLKLMDERLYEASGS